MSDKARFAANHCRSARFAASQNCRALPCCPLRGQHCHDTNERTKERTKERTNNI